MHDMNSSQGAQKGVIAAIVFAALVISGSLVFLGLQLSSSGSASIASDDVEATEQEINDLIEQLKKEDPSLFADLPGDAPAEAPVNADLAALMDDDAIMGNKNAPITIVEFSDYQCPFCARHFSQTLPEIKKNFIDNGKVNYVYRDFPLSFHYDATPAAIAAECFREQKGDAGYYLIHEKIFEGASSGSIPMSSLEAYAEELGANMTSFKSCMSEQKYADEVQKDTTDGSLNGINGTPGFIITNGTTAKRLSGAQPYAAFKAAIESL